MLPEVNVVSSVIDNVRDQKVYKTRYFYNAKVFPANVDVLLARRRQKCQVLRSNGVRSRVICSTICPRVTHSDLSHPNVHSNNSVADALKKDDNNVANNLPHNPAAKQTSEFESGGSGFESFTSGDESGECKADQSSSGLVAQDVVVAEPTGHGFTPSQLGSESSWVTDYVSPTVMTSNECLEQVSGYRDKQKVAPPEGGRPGFEFGVRNDTCNSNPVSVNAAVDKSIHLCPIYDVNNVGMEEKFVNTIIFANQKNKDVAQGVNSPIYSQWQQQVDFQFGFVPLGCQLMPRNDTLCNSHDYSPIEMHNIVKRTGKPNFMEARLPVTSQLNVDKWKSLLTDYWDQQLLQLLQFGFPLDFNRCCPLQHEVGNHSSANGFPADVDAYIAEECKFAALLGPFEVNPIENSHSSPFMTRNKPNSDRRRVIIDLSWPLGALVNAGIDKNTYLDAPFSLTFPTVDDITSELKCLGRGALLYKIDVSHAFCHVKVDPGDYDLLGLQWRHAYVDTCVPFGTRH